MRSCSSVFAGTVWDGMGRYGKYGMYCSYPSFRNSAYYSGHVWYPYGTVTPYITATNQMPADRQPNSRGVALPHLVSLGESSCSPPGQFFYDSPISRSLYSGLINIISYLSPKLTIPSIALSPWSPSSNNPGQCARSSNAPRPRPSALSQQPPVPAPVPAAAPCPSSRSSLIVAPS